MKARLLDWVRTTFKVEDDVLYRLDTRTKIPAWRPVKIQPTGYTQIGSPYGIMRAHRVVWMLLRGDIHVGQVVDHINGVTSDNRIENLRLVDARGNTNNMKCHRAGKKVGTHKTTAGRWTACIHHEGRTASLGVWDTEEQAHDAYVRAKNHIAQHGTIGTVHTMPRTRRNAKGYYLNARGKWQASIRIEGKPKYLGEFDTEAEAHSAYLAARGDISPKLVEKAPASTAKVRRREFISNQLVYYRMFKGVCLEGEPQEAPKPPAKFKVYGNK